MKKIAFVAGGSGLVGSKLLHALFADPAYEYVISLSRRMLAIKHDKLIQLVADFDHLHEFDALAQLQEKALDHTYVKLFEQIQKGGYELKAFCTLGTTIKKAGSQAAFYKVDHTYVINFGKFAKRYGVRHFLLITAMGADATSSIFYNRVKGEIEEDIKTVGFDQITILRPALILGNRNESRTGESIAKLVMKVIPFFGPIKKYKPVHDYVIARAMRAAAESDQDAYSVIESIEIQTYK
ncbi:NAD-dependent epimerase/dehydratase family protein [Penaeicola halotolerans]|uniref:NAD-dependent epimerase/dehydratase family protein n=1 Tax=Penaeicola halotolerans TaxID=2793196 RepID=UPI001CF80852|nr:NAD-dependent epimerase/dehydratase family protein [Penaeicola halotolerans]